jgi:hypothetical protein
MKKHMLINLLLALFQDGQTTPNIQAIQKALGTRKSHAKALLHKQLEDELVLNELSQVTIVISDREPMRVGTIRLKQTRYWPDRFYFEDGTSVWVRTVVKEVVECLPRFIEEDEEEVVIGAC